MSPQPLLYHMPPSTFKKLLLVIFLVSLTAVFLGCKPSAIPSTLSPLPTPSSTSLSTTTSEKPIPSVIAPTPLSAFLPEINTTPAGTGAIGYMLPAFYVHDFIVENVWFKDTEEGTLRTYVYGGFIPAPGGFPTQQGVVVVQVLKMDSHGGVKEVYYRLFPTPTQSGSVHITGAIGERLILQATNGIVFYFDAPLRQFVPSLSWTPTPGPISPMAIPTLPPATASP